MSPFNRTKADGHGNGSPNGRRESAPESTFDAARTDLIRTGDVAVHLRALGLPENATWEEAVAAHRRLVSDLTPGPEASHSNVELAEQYLQEVNQAFASLRVLSVA